MRVATGLTAFGLALLSVTIGLSQDPQRPKTGEKKYELVLGERRFDPHNDAPEFPADWGDAASSGPDLQLVQLYGPTKSADLAQLKAAGIDIVTYIHPFTYVVWAKPLHDLDGPRYPFVRWTGPFLPAYRVLPRWRFLDASQVNARIMIYRGADRAAILATLQNLDISIVAAAPISDAFEILSAEIPGNLFSDIARIAGVYSIQPLPTDGGDRGEMSCQVNVNNINTLGDPFPGYMTWLAGVNLDGDGVILANVDSGIDEAHPDLADHMLPCTGTTCGGAAMSSHGTHTAGIMAGDGSSGATSYSFLRGLGVAPGASLVEQVYSPHFALPDGMLLLMQDSYQNGAILSGNSWGPSGSPLGYDNHTLQVDIGVRDADATQPGNQAFTYVLSIMNGWGGTSTQGTPDEAKNIITVGATKMLSSAGIPVPDFDDLSDRTAHGPCLDGRKIPHLVAPGCYVDSTTPGASHGLKCGTSMASPQVSGGIALFVEQYRVDFPALPDPSPALIKAVFLVTARDLFGHDDADGNPLGHPFDSKQGFGRMNLEAVVDGTAPMLYFDNPQLLDETGEFWVTRVAPWSSAHPMKFMLIWTDAPGHGLGGSTPAWNNDLDLNVDDGSVTYRGNDFGTDGWSVPDGTSDGMNNTEGVFLGPTVSGDFTVRVVGANINSDGVPQVGDETDQDFALVCLNCVGVADFWVRLTPAAQTICAGDEAVYQIDLDAFWGYTDPVGLAVTGQPAGATVTFSQNPVVPPASITLTISDTASATAGAFDLVVTGTSTSGDHDATAQLDLVDTAPAPPTLLSPADDAMDQSREPTFDWSVNPSVWGYHFELAEDAAFLQITHSETHLYPPYPLPVTLDPDTTYYWRVAAENVCGFGSPAPSFSFTTAPTPPVLLVDDDDDAPDGRASYAQALDDAGIAFDVFDTAHSDDEPDLDTLRDYSVVVWFTGGCNDGTTGPGIAGTAALIDYLNQGGSLFLSSQDYFAARGFTSFLETTLGVADPVSPDVHHTTVTGTGSVFSGLGPYALDYVLPLTNQSDEVSPDGTAELAFSGDRGDAGVSKSTIAYRTIFLGFPFEAIDSAAARAEVMDAAVTWCAECRFHSLLLQWPNPIRITDLVACIN